MTDEQKLHSYDVEGVGKVSFHKAIFACRAIRPQDYDPTRKALWNKVIAAGMSIPPDYPGRIVLKCQTCRIDVQVGPRQQEFLEIGEADIFCIVCAAEFVSKEHEEGGEPIPLVNLGNPFKRQE